MAVEAVPDSEVSNVSSAALTGAPAPADLKQWSAGSVPLSTGRLERAPAAASCRHCARHRMWLLCGDELRAADGGCGSKRDPDPAIPRRLDKHAIPGGRTNANPGLSWDGGRSEVKEEDRAKPGPGGHERSPPPQLRPAAEAAKEKSLATPKRNEAIQTVKKDYLAVGITNSAPLPIDSGQRCMIDFCLV